MMLALAMIIVGCVHPRAAPRPAEDATPPPPQEFLPTETIYRPGLALSCRERVGPTGLSGGRPNWDGIHGDVDESGRIIAWLEAHDTALRPTSENALRTFAKRRYVFRVDDLASGANLHAIPLPELPGLMSVGSCAAWLTSAHAGVHGRAIAEVARVLERYTFRTLHPDRTHEVETPEDQRQAALELLRRRSDPKGDWSKLPPLPYETTQDERVRWGTLFSMSTARADGPPITSWPMTAALRCKGAFHDTECAGPEDLIVFRARTRAVRLSVRLHFTDNPAVSCNQGTITSLVGISPRRRIVVLGEHTGLFDQEGQTPDEGCHALSAAERYTVFRFDP